MFEIQMRIIQRHVGVHTHFKESCEVEDVSVRPAGRATVPSKGRHGQSN